MLLRSKALEITVESSLVSGLNFDRQDNLAQLLGAFLSGDAAVVLSSALCRLAGLLSDEAPDTLGAAQRAVHGVISVLKSGDEQDADAAGALAAWVSRVAGLDKEIARQQGQLQKMITNSGGGVTK